MAVKTPQDFFELFAIVPKMLTRLQVNLQAFAALTLDLSRLLAGAASGKPTRKQALDRIAALGARGYSLLVNVVEGRTVKAVDVLAAREAILARAGAVRAEIGELLATAYRLLVRVVEGE